MPRDYMPKHVKARGSGELPMRERRMLRLTVRGDAGCVKVCYTEALFLSDYRLTERGLARRAAETTVR